MSVIGWSVAFRWCYITWIHSLLMKTHSLIHLILICTQSAEPSSIMGPNRLKLYIFALVDFNLKTHICTVKLHGQGKDSPPLYTCRQCNPSQWVVLKGAGPSPQPIALVSQEKGLMPKFTAWNLCVSPNVNQALIISLTVCIDWFVLVMKKESIRFM